MRTTTIVTRWLAVEAVACVQLDRMFRCRLSKSIWYADSEECLVAGPEDNDLTGLFLSAEAFDGQG